MGCHILLQCMEVKSESEVTQSCLTLSNSMDCSPPGSSVHGIFQPRVLEWGAIAFSPCPWGTLKAHPMREGEAQSELVEALCIAAFCSEITDHVSGEGSPPVSL